MNMSRPLAKILLYSVDILGMNGNMEVNDTASIDIVINSNANAPGNAFFSIFLQGKNNRININHAFSASQRTKYSCKKDKKSTYAFRIKVAV